MTAWVAQTHPRFGAGRTDGRRWWIRPERPEKLPALVAAGGLPVSGPPESVPAPQADLLLDISALDAVRSVDPDSGVAHVEAGCTWDALEATLNHRGLTLGPVPRWLVGRTIAETLAGRFPLRPSPRYGDLRDALLALRAALPSGLTDAAVAPRRATGPDLGRVPLGAGHRAGLIADVHIRAWPAEEARTWRRVRFAGWSEARAAAMAILADGLRPAWWCLRRIRRQVSLDLELRGPRLDRLEARLDAVLDASDGQRDPSEEAEALAEKRFWRPGADFVALNPIKLVDGADLGAAVDGIPRVEVWDLRPEGATIHVAREVDGPPPDAGWSALAERVFAALAADPEGAR